MLVVFLQEVSSALPYSPHFSDRDKGGFAFKSQSVGFGSNTVLNYEVVLANGTVVNANTKSHPDLFWALKLAGSNYGIITRFDMRTYHSPAIWGSVNIYPFTDQVVTEAFSDYQAYSHDNSNTNISKAVVLAHQGRQKVLLTCISSGDGTPVDPVTNAEPLQHLEKTGSTHDVVKDVIAAVVPGETRGAWVPFTTKATTNIALDMFGLVDKVYGSLLDKEGVSVCVNSQAFQRNFIEATCDSPVYNGLRQSSEDLTCEPLPLLPLPFSLTGRSKPYNGHMDRSGTRRSHETCHRQTG